MQPASGASDADERTCYAEDMKELRALFGAAAALALGCVVENTRPTPVPPLAPPSHVPSQPPATLPPPAAMPSNTASAAEPGVAVDAAPPLTSAPASSGDFYACGMDWDCTAVPKVGCCNNGQMEAVNTASVDAYQRSFTCTERVMCPQFMIRDTRVPECSEAPQNAMRKCEMVKIEDIKCGGSGVNPHACPASYQCKPSSASQPGTRSTSGKPLPDAPGTCSK